MLPYHVTDSVVLRLLQEHHAPELFALMDGNRAFLRQSLSWLDKTTEVEHSRLFIRECLKSFLDTTAFVCGIWHHHQLCGVIGHNDINWDDRSVNIGYWLAENQQGHGIITRCCRVFIDHAFNEYGLDRVELHIATGNEKSQTIAYRLGFTRTGVIKEAEWLYDHFLDHTVYVLHRPASP